MKLLIDAGNTNIKFAKFENHRCSELPQSSFMSLIKDADVIVIAKVKEYSLFIDVESKAKEYDVPVIFPKVEPISFGVTCGYKNVKHLGIDRWLGVLAATISYPNRPLIVVDSGTAMTIDFVLPNKTHIGGWITPGLTLMKNSIVERAPLVFVNNNIDDERIGTDTPSALLNGCLFSLVGTIDKARDEIRRQLSDDEKNNILIVLTGGDRGKIARLLTCDYVENKFLIFEGLSLFS